MLRMFQNQVKSALDQAPVAKNGLIGALIGGGAAIAFKMLEIAGEETLWFLVRCAVDPYFKGDTAEEEAILAETPRVTFNLATAGLVIGALGTFAYNRCQNKFCSKDENTQKITTENQIRAR